jgi:hypothetical protein
MEIRSATDGVGHNIMHKVMKKLKQLHFRLKSFFVGILIKLLSFVLYPYSCLLSIFIYISCFELVLTYGDRTNSIHWDQLSRLLREDGDRIQSPKRYVLNKEHDNGQRSKPQ